MRLPERSAGDLNILRGNAFRPIAAKIGGEPGILLGAHQPAERHLPLESLLESRFGLHLPSYCHFHARDDVRRLTRINRHARTMPA